MEKIKTKAIIFLLIAFSSVGLFAQTYEFTVNSGTAIQGAKFGYSLNPKLCLYVGLDIIGISVDVEGKDSDYESWSYGGNTYSYEYLDKWKYSGSAFLFIPRLGCKYKLFTSDLHPYLYGDLFKSFASVDVTGKVESWEWEDGELEYYDLDKIDSGKESDAIADFLGFWGINFGVGVEYPISEHFGVSGEFGFRMLFASSEYKDVNSDSSYQEEWREEWKSEIVTTFTITTSSISINYHF